LTGVPTAPTAEPGTNTNQIATTEFVKAAALTGPTGAKGVQGLAGADGAAGAQGIQGLAGVNGAAGTQGIQGLAGTNGAAGAQGIQGLRGSAGAAGVAGSAGSQGIQGLTGAVGTTGAAGAQGIQGLTGSVADVAAISGTSTANGASITSGVLSLAPADATNGGIITTGAQIFAGAKTFSSTVTTNVLGVGTNSPSASAQLDVSSTSKGFLPPRMTEEQRDLIAVNSVSAGLIIWCTNCGVSGELEVYNGVTWTNMVGASAALSTVLMGSQYWRGKNLDVATYRDGTVIPQVTNNADWTGLTTGAWCYYNNDPANGAIYGKLYNWYAVAGIWNEASKTDASQRKKLAPTGFHVPTDEEWLTLSTNLGGNTVAGGKMKTTGTTRWTAPNTDATNESGFAALPGGFRASDGKSYQLGAMGFWFSATDFDSGRGGVCYLENYDGWLGLNPDNKFFGFSVRCLRD
jgi:uncharacterized protein (TIGR02145 family)